MNEVIIYTTINKETRIDVTFEGKTVWLSLAQIALLCDRDKSVISRHLKRIFTKILTFESEKTN